MMAAKSVVSKDVPMVVCWAERSVVSTVVLWVAGRDASMAGRSAARSVGRWVALMDAMMAASMVASTAA